MSYFETEGSANTQAVIDLALETAAKQGIEHIVVATTQGQTPKLLKGAKGVKVIAVTHAFGFKEKGKSSITPETRQELTDAGITLHTASHTLSGIERGLTSKAGGGLFAAEIIAHTLRFFGQGTKVAVEVATSALDAGLIPQDAPVIAIGGTHSGADTAIVLVPANSNRILETRIREVLAKPY
jgi:uncharacterized protein